MNRIKIEPYTFGCSESDDVFESGCSNDEVHCHPPNNDKHIESDGDGWFVISTCHSCDYKLVIKPENLMSKRDPLTLLQRVEYYTKCCVCNHKVYVGEKFVNKKTRSLISTS